MRKFLRILGVPRGVLRRGTAKNSGGLNFDDAAIARDPYPHYEQLRRSGAVHFLPHHGAWIVLGYDDVQSVLARPDVFSNRFYTVVDSVLLGADPPDHTAMRRVVGRYFSTAAVERLARFAEERAAALLKEELEVVSEFARPLSESVAAELIGFDERAVSAIHDAYAQPGGFPVLVASLDAVAERAAMYRSLLDDGVPDAQARSLVRLLWLASTATAERTISRAVFLLLRHTEVRDAAQLPAFVEEVLRLHPAEMVIRRIAVTETNIGGIAIPADSTIFLALGAANRDPAKFDAPSELRLDRQGSRHLSFGHGIHHCIGGLLGRRETEAALRVLLRAAPALRAAHPLENAVIGGSLTENAVHRLVVRLA